MSSTLASPSLDHSTSDGAHEHPKVGTMKISCNREKLLSVFQVVAAVAPSRSPKPILRNIKLEVTAEGATLLATDLEIGIRIAVPEVEVEIPGEAILPIARFGAILRESSDEKLSLEADSQGTSVHGERSQFKLPAEDPAEFPTIAEFQEEAYFEVSGRLFREMIRRTVLATDNESSRYALGGVLLEFDADKIVAVGTDGRRLSKMEGPVARHGEPADSEGTTIVPTRAMQLIERAISDLDSEIAIAARGNEILVRGPHMTIHTRLLEGRFPRWRDVFPSREGVISVDLPVAGFYGAVRQAAIATSEESRGIDFTFADGSVVLAGQAADVGQARVELPVAYDGQSLTIKLDPRFVMDFLKVLSGDTSFKLELRDHESAAVCWTDDGFGYVIMPLASDR